MSLVIETCTAQHLGDRHEQQDRVAIYSHGRAKSAKGPKSNMLAVLADGMGGHTGGELAAEQVLLHASQNFEAVTPTPDMVRDFLGSVIKDAHDAIRLTRYTSETEPHSTACLLLLQNDRADWAHCGDSRIYHFRNGKRVARTVDHSYVMNLVQRGLITEMAADTHPNKNILISCLGDEAEPRVEFGHTSPLVGGDSFLLCSDGLWAYFSDLELARILNDYTPRKAAEFLIETARTRAHGGGDNCSLAIVKVKEEVKTPLARLGQRGFLDSGF